MHRALVTGGAGFIGSHVVAQLLDHGCAVHVIDDLSAGKREHVDPRASLRVADVRSPEAAEIVANGDFDVVAHLAAQVDVRRSVADPAFDASTNVLGALNLLEAVRARPTGRRPRVVFASTGGALYGGSAPLPTPETHQPTPESPYGVAKLSVEHYLEYYARVWGIDAVALRFGNVFGPRQDPGGEAGVIAIFAGRMARGDALTVYGDGTQTRDYVYVSDVADAFVRASACALPPLTAFASRAFNVGTGVSSSVLDVIDALSRVAGAPADVRFAPPRAGELLHSALDVRKAERVLGWRSTVSLHDGLANTYAWVRAGS